MKPSKRGQFNRADAERVIRNGIIFFAPAALIFLTAIQAGATIEEASLTLQVWLLNTVVDVLRKFVAGK